MPTGLGGFDLVCRLLGAALAGGVIGYERERSHKPAGLRTHMLIALGAACFTSIAVELHRKISIDAVEWARMDPIRIVVGIVSGLGFLGAGTILQARDDVSGLTTAAGIWTVAAIGVACGTGAFRIAMFTTAISLAVPHPLRWMEFRMKSSFGGTSRRVEVAWHARCDPHFREMPARHPRTSTGGAFGSWNPRTPSRTCSTHEIWIDVRRFSASGR